MKKKKRDNNLKEDEKEKRRNSYSLVRSNRLVTAVGNGPTIDTA